MTAEQKYCVAAEDRETGIRSAITSAMDYASAMIFKSTYSKDRKWKKMCKYFHVAKFPYKPHTNHYQQNNL